MTGAWLALWLAAAPPGCEGAAGLSPEALAAQAPALAAEAARAGPAGAIEALAAELSSSPPAEREARAARFAAALAWHCRLAEEPPELRPLAPAERAALERLLLEPRFSRARPLEERLLAWLGQLWDRLAELLGTEEAEDIASRGRTAFFALVALGALAVAATALRRRRALRSAPAPASPVPAAPPPPAVDLDLAEAALRAGQPAEAIRTALIAALGALEQAERLPSGRALTNAETVRHLAASTPAVAVAFGLLSSAFDRAIYGLRPPSAEEARACLEAARRLRATLGEAR